MIWKSKNCELRGRIAKIKMKDGEMVNFTCQFDWAEG